MFVQAILKNNMMRKTVSVADSTTLRSVLDDNEFDYGTGMLMLNGVAVDDVDLDSTLSDLGVGERFTVSNVHKHDNAATLQIVGNAFVVRGGHPADAYKRVKKYHPDALQIVEGEKTKNVVFQVGVTEDGTGCISKYGAEFCDPGNEGDAMITMLIPADVTDREQYIIDTYGPSWRYINKIDAQVTEALTLTDNEINEVRAAITVL